MSQRKGLARTGQPARRRGQGSPRHGDRGPVRSSTATETVDACRTIATATASATIATRRSKSTRDARLDRPAIGRRSTTVGLAFDLREIRDAVHRVAEPREQAKAPGADADVGSLTVTLSKNASIGARSEASAAIAAVKSSASIAALAVGSREQSSADGQTALSSLCRSSSRNDAHGQSSSPSSFFRMLAARL